MPGTTTGKKLDLSKLTDEEAKHIWEVVQRDFDLRKKEDDRLGELKTKIEKEDTKRELLGNQTSLTESYCIRCLQPFKFLVNSKRQCLDCQLYICKLCSRYNKKEHGWVCDPCRMARVLKIGTLEWYHENVRARFKRFGSAKVMRSLFKRLNGEHSCSQNDLEADGYEEHSMDATDSQHYEGMKKAKRRLTVDPFDFKLDCGYSIESRGRSNQAPVSHDIMDMDVGVRESMLAEADMASVFHQILEEQRKGLDLGLAPQQDDPYPDNRTIPSRSISRLSYSSCGSGSAWGPQGSSSYLPGPDDSEEDDHPYPLYQSHLGPCSHASRDSLYSSNPPPQITDLSRRMSAIETLLNHLEFKVAMTYDETSQAPLTPNSTSPPPQWEEVEQQPRQKLHVMMENISDDSSDEEESSRPHSSQETPARRTPDRDAKPSRLPRHTSRTSIIVSRLEEEEPQQTETQTSQAPLTPNSTSPPPQWEEVEQKPRQKLHVMMDNISDDSSDEEEPQQTETQTSQAPLTPNSTSPPPQWEEVEQKPRQKLHVMMENISDDSSDEEESSRPHSSQETPARRTPDRDAKPSRLPRHTSRTSIIVSRLEEEEPQQTETQTSQAPLTPNSTSPPPQWEEVEQKPRQKLHVMMENVSDDSSDEEEPQQTETQTSHLTDSLEKWLPPEAGSEAGFRGSTAFLNELEDKVAQAAANVQNAQREVSYIENRIAALNIAGMPVDKRRRSVIPIQARRLSHNFPTSQADRFVRNSLYRGSLTQRNPVAKPKTTATSAKPVMTQGM